jgi:Flp pilus assembly pilin Flp
MPQKFSRSFIEYVLLPAFISLIIYNSMIITMR